MNSRGDYMTFIKSEFQKAVSNYAQKIELQNLLWDEVEKAYSGKKRFYHTLSHLDNLLSNLVSFKNQFGHWDIIIFAIVYHDFIYDVLKSDNEERSARYAENKLMELNLDLEGIDFCIELILATKKHRPASREIDLFTDADLSILGSNTKAYQEYTKCIRREYSIFPSLIYNPGRRKVIIHFLEMKKIFKTKEFYEQYETQARQNLKAELLTLR